MKNMIIVSLHFGPGHIAHLKAWYNLCDICGYNAMLYIEEQYVKYYKNSIYKFCTRIEDVYLFKPDYAIVYNTGFENISFFNWCDKNACKIIYVLHEPFTGIKELLKEGSYAIKQTVACVLNLWFCKKAEKIVLCSQYAENNCKQYMEKAYEKKERFPLIFLDEYEDCGEERKYFSLIGTYATSKGSDLFIKFIKESVKRGYNIEFQIATRSNINEQLKDKQIQDLIRNGKLIVQQGRNMTTSEINKAYRRSICCWNGYRRSTQSGVLPNAFMLGTPVLATKIGSFEEFVIPGHTGEFIDNNDMYSIYQGFLKIKKHSKTMSNDCRLYFLENFYYKNQSIKFKSMIESLK